MGVPLEAVLNEWWKLYAASVVRNQRIPADAGAFHHVEIGCALLGLPSKTVSIRSAVAPAG
jgi:hypothetical protein